MPRGKIAGPRSIAHHSADETDAARLTLYRRHERLAPTSQTANGGVDHEISSLDKVVTRSPDGEVALAPRHPATGATGNAFPASRARRRALHAGYAPLFQQQPHIAGQYLLAIRPERPQVVNEIAHGLTGANFLRVVGGEHDARRRNFDERCLHRPDCATEAGGV